MAANTPPRTIVSPKVAPSTAPSHFRSVESSKFTVYEDPFFNDPEPIPTSPTPISEPSEDKENQFSAVVSAPPTSSRMTANAAVSPREVLNDVTESIVTKEYQNVQGQNFKVISSPTSKFYCSSSSQKFKYPFSYEAKMSASYNPLGVNLFGRIPNFANKSPSRFYRLPTHLHPSSLGKRLFSVTSLRNALKQGSTLGGILPSMEVDAPLESPITPERKRNSDAVDGENDSETKTYELRPRPTPKPTQFSYATLGSPEESLNITVISSSVKHKKKKRLETKR